MGVDLSQAIPFDMVATFEAVAASPGDGGISANYPYQFVLERKH